jgi:hypothetical protein
MSLPYGRIRRLVVIPQYTAGFEVQKNAAIGTVGCEVLN